MPSTSVFPPNTQGNSWWRWVHSGGRSQPGQTHRRSRSASALLIFGVAVRYFLPTCRGSPRVLSRMGVISASPAIRRSARPEIGRVRRRRHRRPLP
jgi:hypothetical protein